LSAENAEFKPIAGGGFLCAVVTVCRARRPAG